jgi:hypothetical protein
MTWAAAIVDAIGKFFESTMRTSPRGELKFGGCLSNEKLKDSGVEPCVPVLDADTAWGKVRIVWEKAPDRSSNI